MPRKRKKYTGGLIKRGGVFYYKIRNTDGAFAVRSLHTRIKGEAEAQLDQRMTEVKAGTFNPNAEDVRVCDLMPAVWNDYEKRHRRTLDWAKARWERHLRPYLGMLLAEQVGTEDLNSYILARQKEGAKDASINRELALLKRAYHLAMKARPRRVSIVPPIDMLTEDNIRTGFVEYGDYVKLAEACRKVGLWLRAMFEVTYCYGFRRGEMLSLRVRQIDLLERVIRLDPLTTKSRRGRMVVMTESVYQLLQQCVLGKSGDDYVFTRDGEPVHDFRGAWDAVRKQAALPALLWHDLRRTGVRNQLRAGTSEKICMEISGHRTAEVFRRYDISALSDLEDAARKLEAYQKSLKDKYTDKYTLAPTIVQSKNAIDDVNYTVDS
jgi:integrase